MPVTPGSVICFGEVLIDLIATDGNSLETAEQFDIQPGGAPANVAVGLARLDIPTAFCGVVGEDPFGARLRATLQDAGVDTRPLRCAPGEHSSMAMAWKDHRGDGHFRLLRMADLLLAPMDAENAGIADAGAIVVGSVSLATEPSRSAISRAVELAVGAQVPVCFDVNYRPGLWPNRRAFVEACEPIFSVAGVVKLSLDDATGMGIGAGIPSAVVAATSRHTHQIVILTDGARGAWAGTADRMIGQVPAFPVNVVDPTGAGDAFTAAVIARMIERNWEGFDADDLRFAAASGALVTTQSGAMNAMPTRLQIGAFLQSKAGD